MGKPKIRFKGYTDDWEQRKWMNSVDISTEMVDPASGEYDDMPHIAPGNIESFTGRILDNVRTVKEEQLISGKFRFRPDDVVYGKINPQLGKYFYASVDGLTSADAYVFKGKNGIRQKFLFSMLQTSDFFKYSVSVSKRSGMPKINRDELNAYAFLAPSEEEQDKIGNFLLEIDHLITLHQRKCDETQKLKKYMLQKMFPQNGKKVPEIRFSGFTDDWEQRKVTDLGEIYIGLVTTMTEHYTDKGHLLIRNSDIKDGYFEFGENPIYLDEEFSEQNKSRMHQLGDVITVHTGDIGTSAVIGENEVNSIGFATIVTRPNQEILDSNYFATYLNTDTHKQWAISMATGDGRSNYNLKDYTKLVVPIPEIEEQKKIATCIVNLNSLITLHQRKCDELRIIKKFMLQNMFV